MGVDFGHLNQRSGLYTSTAASSAIFGVNRRQSRQPPHGRHLFLLEAFEQNFKFFLLELPKQGLFGSGFGTSRLAGVYEGKRIPRAVANQSGGPGKRPLRTSKQRFGPGRHQPERRVRPYAPKPISRVAKIRLTPMHDPMDK